MSSAVDAAADMPKQTNTASNDRLVASLIA
jgi:hypothetical protein